MQLEDYPAQDPLSDFAQGYAAEVGRKGEGIEGEDRLYGKNPYQSIGIHKPLHPTGAVFAFIHGGGWTNGYKEWNNFMAPAFTSRGIIFVSIGYRLAPMHYFPVGLEDCAAGFAWVYNNISEYGGDPQQLYLGGHSAGGHYSSLLAVKKDWQSALGIPVGTIRGCIPVSGVYRFGEGSGLSMRPRFLGDAGSGISAAASPILHIKGKICPFLMAHGDEDFPHLVIQANEMEEALVASGATVDRTVLSNCDHFGTHYACGEDGGDWFGKILNFIAA